MKKPTIKQAGVLALTAVLGTAAVWAGAGAMAGVEEKGKDAGAAKAALESGAAPKAVLSVNAVAPQSSDWPTTLEANGSIAAWQEAVVGSELGGLRLADVRVNVGDVVRQGQVLARFTTDSVGAEVAQQQASVEEAEAAMSEAEANARRARTLSTSGAISGQQTEQYMTAERSAKARLGLAVARLKVEQIRLSQVDVLAPDEGVISGRSATVGAVVQQGQELFKLIRKGRIEWRAEVPSSELARIKPGQRVQLRTAGGTDVEGRVRALAPAVDANTRSALVYVDLPVPGEARAGMFASGTFELGNAQALTVPHSAVVTYDGYSYVFAIDKHNKVAQTKVTLGRSVGPRIEVISGLWPGAAVVGQGAGFLNDGDTVQVLGPAKTPAVTSLASR